MPTPSIDLGVADVKACIDGCMRWLMEAGFLNEAEPKPMADDPRALAVGDAFLWLQQEVLPELDDRREQQRLKMKTEKVSREVSATYPDRAEMADLFFSSEDGKLARDVHRHLARQSALKKRVAAAQQRRSARLTRIHRPPDNWVQDSYNQWLAEGATFLSTLERGKLVPRTKAEWARARADWEDRLRIAGFQDKEIADILPGGGDADQVLQRRYRRRRRTRVP